MGIATSKRKRRNDLAKRATRTFRLEQLEARSLMAADTALGVTAATWGSSDMGSGVPLSAVMATPAEGESPAEGETQGTAVDLVAFAKALEQSGTLFYGAIWCTFCNQQKALFEDGMDPLPFVEVTNPDHTLNSAGTAANITSFPTWVFPDQSRATGVLSLATLAQRAGISIPQGNKPTFAPIADVTIEAGSAVWIPLNGYDPNGDRLTYSATSANSSLVGTNIPTGNRSLKMDVKNWGTMTFELFDNLVPRITNHIAELADSGFYNADTANGIATNFDQAIRFPTEMIQTGEPAGSEGLGSDLGPVDDQFDLSLRHNSAGLLTLVKSTGDDTGDSRFAVMGEPDPSLDFDWSVFGRLVEGDAERAGINETTTDANDTPTRIIQLNSVSTFTDFENRVLSLKAPAGATGSTDVTVIVSDGWGHSYQQTFRVTVVASTWNAGPFLQDIPSVGIARDQSYQWTAIARDAEGDPVQFDATLLGPGQLQINSTTGQITVTPEADFAGDVFLDVVVHAAPGTPNDTTDPFDRQTVRIEFSSSNSAWHNSTWEIDVDDDGTVAPLDALLILNEINNRVVSSNTGLLPTMRIDGATAPRYFDTNDDGYVVPLDALIVINVLNDPDNGLGEGEAAAYLGDLAAQGNVNPAHDPLWDSALLAWLEATDSLGAGSPTVSPRSRIRPI